MSTEFTHLDTVFYVDGQRILRKGKGLFRPWRTLDTRLHAPLADREGVQHLAIYLTGSINRGTTARLTGQDADNGTLTFRLTDFQDRQLKQIRTIGAPVFADKIPTVETNQTFSGFELIIQPAGECVLRGLGVEQEPIEIAGLLPEHVRGATLAITGGAMKHLGINYLGHIQSVE